MSRLPIIVQSPFPHRVYCGTCGCLLVRDHENYGFERTNPGFHCPNNPDASPSSCFFMMDLEQLVCDVLAQERKTAKQANRRLRRIERAFGTDLEQTLSSVYRDPVEEVTATICENTEKINQLFLTQEKPGTLPDDLRAKVEALYAQNQKLAVRYMHLATEWKNCSSDLSADNPWLALYTALPKQFKLTPKLSEYTVYRIEVFHDGSVTVRLKLQEEKTRLLSCIKATDKWKFPCKQEQGNVEGGRDDA